MKRVAYRLKSLLKKNVVCYKVNCLIKWSLKNRKCALSTKYNHLCVEAYPSSANSFLYYYLKYLKSELNIAHHTHTIANLKIAQKLDIPIYVIIRKPIDAIASRSIRFNVDVNNSIIDYIEFYEYCLNNICRIKIFKFEDVIYRTVEIINNIFKDINLQDRIKNDISEEVKNYMKNFQKDKSNMSLPDEKRNFKKKEIKDLIKNNRNFIKAESLYNDIVKSRESKVL